MAFFNLFSPYAAYTAGDDYAHKGATAHYRGYEVTATDGMGGFAIRRGGVVGGGCRCDGVVLHVTLDGARHRADNLDQVLDRAA